MFFFGFSALYKPSDFHASGTLSYEATMAIYCLIAGISIILYIKILKYISWFREIKDWTLIRELLSIFFVLTGTCIIVYVAGFAIEAPENRLNLRTFLNSFKNVFSVGIIPFAFFTAANYQYLFSKGNKQGEPVADIAASGSQIAEDLVQISSQLKKEELKFYPSQFLYAESDGNYVVFYLIKDNLVKKQIIRNSISRIEKQLSAIPYFLRTHRSFIVNLKKVTGRQGNILGYQLKIGGTESKVPVSRERIRIFDSGFARYHS